MKTPKKRSGVVGRELTENSFRQFKHKRKRLSKKIGESRQKTLCEYLQKRNSEGEEKSDPIDLTKDPLDEGGLSMVSIERYVLLYIMQVTFKLSPTGTLFDHFQSI